MPKAEHPFIQKKEAPMPVTKPAKEVPKEKPAPIYQPVMPIQLPEIDINNYYTMNLQQLQAQVQQPAKEKPAPAKELPAKELPAKELPAKELPVKEQPAPIPKKEVPLQKPISKEVPEAPQMPVMPVMPTMPAQQNMCPPVYQYCYPMPMMPMCDPCYPMMQPFGHHPHMMAQYPGMQNPAQMPFMQQGMPAAMPGMQMPAGNWDLDDWDNDYDDESPNDWENVQGFGNPGYPLPMQYPNVNMPMDYNHQPFPVAGMQDNPNEDCGCGGGNAQMSSQHEHPFFQQAPQMIPQMMRQMMPQMMPQIMPQMMQQMPNQSFAPPVGYEANPYGMPNPELSYALPTYFRVGNDEE